LTKPQPAVSTYSTGGGGVSFERRVAALNLARLLRGDGPQAGSLGLRLVRVEFQQTQHIVDDLALRSESEDDDGEKELLLLTVRARPKLIKSDQKSAELLAQVLAATQVAAEAGTRNSVALVVAGTQSAASQLGGLAALAASHPSVELVTQAVNKLGRRDKLRTRLDHLSALIKLALEAAGTEAKFDEKVATATFGMLSRLRVLQPRLEDPDVTDWDNVIPLLRPLVKDQQSAAALALRDRLEVISGEYAVSGAIVTRSKLIRDVHDLIAPVTRAEQPGALLGDSPSWQRLRQLQTDWEREVRSVIGPLGVQGTHLGRDSLHSELIAAFSDTSTSGAVLVHGASGSGKSAAVLAAASALEGDSAQWVGLSLRHLPGAALKLTEALGMPLVKVLSELSAPLRLLIIDGADAASEGMDAVLSHVVQAARLSDVLPVVAVASENLDAVRALVSVAAAPPSEVHILYLSEGELAMVGTAYPSLEPLLRSPLARELLGRPAILDMLLRANTTELPLTDSAAMLAIWTGLVRGGPGGGTPEAREATMRLLSRQCLDDLSFEDVVDSLDGVAVAGLQADGVLARGSWIPWRPLPRFTHDLLRHYALAQLMLLDGRPGTRLSGSAVPRWSLPAARLACEAVLAAQPEDVAAFTSLQEQFLTVVERSGVQRWADVPTEALLTAGWTPQQMASAWPGLTSAHPEHVERCLRTLEFRHTPGYVLDARVSEPVVFSLLTNRAPKGQSQDVTKELKKLRVEFLRSLVFGGAPAGQPTRLLARIQLVARLDAALAAKAADDAARIAAMTPQEKAATAEFEGLSPMTFPNSLPKLLGMRRSSPSRRGTGRRSLPRELYDKTNIEELALLAADIGEAGERLLRLVLELSPGDLAPAVEAMMAPYGLGAWSPGLLRDLTEGYYIEEEEDEPLGFYGGSLHRDGIRRHQSGGDLQLRHYTKGSFLALLRYDFIAGVATINKVLSAATRWRTPKLSGEPDLTGYAEVLSVTGESRTYLGDANIWNWYRGTGNGPYPSTSALQALEHQADVHLAAGVPISWMVELLLSGADSLSMVALVVGMLVRHLDEAGEVLDAFRLEPQLWLFEQGRVGSETSGLAVPVDGVAHPDRRRMELADVAFWLTLGSAAPRRAALRAVGEQLLTTAKAQVEAFRPKTPSPGQLDAFEQDAAEYLAKVAGWAATLDFERFTFEQDDDGQLVASVSPPKEPAAALVSKREEQARVLRVHTLYFRYGAHRLGQPAPDVEDDEFISDLALARELHDEQQAAATESIDVADEAQESGTVQSDLPGMRAGDVVAAVAATALERALLQGQQLPKAELTWAAGVLADSANHLCGERSTSLLGWADASSTARGLPLLLMPGSEALLLSAWPGGDGADWALACIAHLSVVGSQEAKLTLARSLDPVWNCVREGDGCTRTGDASSNDSGVGYPNPCIHQRALSAMGDSARHSVLGPWDQERQEHSRPTLTGDLALALASAEPTSINASELSPALRAAGSAAVSSCPLVAADATRLLDALLAAHQLAMTEHEERYDHYGDDALAAARAVLTSSRQDPERLGRHLSAYADDAQSLSSALRALPAAGEENEQLASAAAELWPSVMGVVLDLLDAGHEPHHRDDYGADVLAALIPRSAPEVGYLTREQAREPHRGAALSTWQPQVSRWAAYARGRPTCVDSLIAALRQLPEAEQVAVGMKLVDKVASADFAAMSSSSYFLPSWLGEVKAAASEQGETSRMWQSLVDGLAVAGSRRIAYLTD